ncbi:MAG TPA: globin family protein [Polyangia bacterium]|nr:globin family protein [Polyangia bacterium]
MTPEQKTLVKTTFAQVAPMADAVAEMFYGRLFEMDPSLRALFKIDLHEQGKKLMQTLAVCVANLEHLDVILPSVQALGKRHVAYGVVDAHYDTVGGALLWTLEKGLGAGFTPEVKEAWTTVYVTLSGVMKDAARAA